MYYLIQSNKDKLKDFRLVKSFKDTSEFYDYLDNKEEFLDKEDFVKTITNALEKFGGYIILNDGYRLVNSNYTSVENDSLYQNYEGYNFMELAKNKIREKLINNVIDE